MRPCLRLALLAVLAGSVLVSLPTAGQDGGETLRGEFWTDIDMPGRAGDAYPLPDRVAAERVLDEAAWVFSGMVEGFNFDWTPENKGRQVKESFALEPAASILPGDPRLVPGLTTKTSSRLGAWIDFRPDPSDRLFLESTTSPEWKSAQGRGAYSRAKGWESRRQAYVEAARAAIESWARANEAQRPREIRGRLVFAAIPSIRVEDDAWIVDARVRIEILEVRPWGFF